jgi:hypothetical protein
MLIFWVIIASFSVGFVSGLIRGKLVLNKFILRRDDDYIKILNEQSKKSLDYFYKCLFLMKRELSNLMISLDEKKFEEYFSEVSILSDEIRISTNWSSASKQLERFAKKFPSIHDWDIIGTKEYIVYSETDISLSFHELATRYREICEVEALNDAISGSVVQKSDQEIASLRKYLTLMRDRKFAEKMEYLLEECSLSIQNDVMVIEKNDVSIHYVPHFSERRIGFHFKVTNEYGMIGKFSMDDGSLTTTYYRTDHTFSAEKIISIEPLYPCY